MCDTTDPLIAPRRRTRRLRWLFLGVVAGLTLVVGEFALRLVQGAPIADPYRVVDKLEVLDHFRATEQGVFCANPSSAHWKDPEEANGAVINAQGFRTRSLPITNRHGPVVLFLGDSHTWGASAKPLTESFVDIVDRAGFTTVNLGIPGTGPAQYQRLAELHVPTLRPDVVVIVCYLGNDLSPLDRPLAGVHPLYHVTNAGWLYGYERGGGPVSAARAYELYVLNGFPPWKAKLRQVLREHTRLGWGLYRLASRIRGSPPASAATSKRSKPRGDELYVAARKSFESIYAISRSHGARPLLLLLPSHPRFGMEEVTLDGCQQRFADFSPLVPSLSEEDYTEPPDDHLDLDGHRKLAEFVLLTLRSPPPPR